MCLFTRLGDLCVDQRPAVRKSAGQTLFSTVSTHGGLLQEETWKKVLWQVEYTSFLMLCSGFMKRHSFKSKLYNSLSTNNSESKGYKWKGERSVRIAATQFANLVLAIFFTRQSPTIWLFFFEADSFTLMTFTALELQTFQLGVNQVICVWI